MLDSSLLRQFSSQTLSALLRQCCPGEKDLVLERGVMRRLDRVAGMDVLKACGVRRVFKLQGYKVEAAEAAINRVFMLQVRISSI